MAAEHGHELTDGSHAPHERPEQWGWHHDFTKGRQIMGWFSVVVLALFLTTTHYNLAGALAIVVCMLALIGGLLYDRARSRTQWRG
ncbi:DUF2631 domain-containing protein [Jatrophihabitans telluris]|uniref:DUF2631 domain-containing protein n=1 Tax=Jatrophihabitans telluris TaxID=2038343 RepID=A0ABY4R3B6_9ACTN|nr:DUF2631 domain-containing protein [Jatrophihabitans telluris]UQX90032.1 DUF2631 domain-containing protein [Jatrophihabitans telluris]